MKLQTLQLLQDVTANTVAAAGCLLHHITVRYCNKQHKLLQDTAGCDCTTVQQMQRRM